MGNVVAIGYVRVSTSGQVSDGDGLGLQRERIEAWCGYQGVPLLTIYEDAGISGASVDNRPAFKSAIRSVLELGERAVLVIYRIDRLARNAVEAQQTLELILHSGARVVSISDGVDSGSGMGSTLLKMLTAILSTVAEMEKATITTRLQDGRRRARDRGKIYSVEPAFGMRVSAIDPGSIVPDEREQLVICRMRELRAEGRSYSSIAVMLDREGHRPRRATKWSHVTVRVILGGKRSQRKKAGADRMARARAALLGDEDAERGPSSR